MKNRDPGLATVFSFLLPGLGQVYLGRIGWGIFHFFFHVGLVFIGLAVAFPLISQESGLLFADRLVLWLETPLNMGLAFGVLFLGLANWLWSFMSTSTKELEVEDVEDDIAELVKAARIDFYNDTQKTAILQAAPTTEEFSSTTKLETLLPSKFAQTLAEIMELKDMEIVDLSEITGLTTHEISRYLKGAQPDEATINIIARGLNISPRVLLHETLR